MPTTRPRAMKPWNMRVNARSCAADSSMRALMPSACTPFDDSADSIARALSLTSPSSVRLMYVRSYAGSPKTSV